MTALTWDAVGTRKYETGLDRVVIYPPPTYAGVSWSGVVSIEQSNVGGEINPVYFDGNKIYDEASFEDYQSVLTAFSYPSEFGICDGGVTLAPGLRAWNQPRRPFGLCYRNLISLDTNVNSGYRLTLLYNVMASPSDKAHLTLDEGVTVIGYKWNLSATPAPVTVASGSGYRATSMLVINSVDTNATKLAALEALLYGTSSTSPALPSQATVISTLT